MKNKHAKQIVDAANNPTPPEKEPLPGPDNLLSTGSTLLNLACSGMRAGGFMKGKYYFMVGDSASGKTFLSMSCFAESTRNKAFRKHRLIYDNIEDGCMIDLARLFNEDVADRIEPPGIDDNGDPLYSSTIEEFYYHVDDALERGAPFIYILDSMDALSSDNEFDKFKERKAAHIKGKEVAGSYGDGKAKLNSQNMRHVISRLRNSDSILIVLSQTRDNLGFGFQKKTRSGGRALRFYATVEIWSSIIQTIKQNINGKPRKIGVKVKLEIQKNRQTGRLSEVEVDIYPSFGIDDTGSCVDYLVYEGHWPCRRGLIRAKEFAWELDREKLIAKIEADPQKLDAMKAIVSKTWHEIEKASEIQRQKRYED